MALSKIFFVLALTAVAEAMACNPRKDATCCKDTDKCKNFSQLIQKNPEKCSSSKNFAKRCRASCHVQYPDMNYCVSMNAGKIVPHVALEYPACEVDDDCDDDQFCSVSCHNDAPGCETQEKVCQPCDECHVDDDAVSKKCRDDCVGCPDGGVPPCAPSLDGKIDGTCKTMDGNGQGTCKTMDSCKEVPGDYGWTNEMGGGPVCENREGVDFTQGDDVVCCHDPPEEKKCDGAQGQKGTCKTMDSCKEVPGDYGSSYTTGPSPTYTGRPAFEPVCENREGVDFQQGDDVVCCHDPPEARRRLEAKNGVLEAKDGALEEKMAALEAKLTAA